MAHHNLGYLHQYSHIIFPVCLAFFGLCYIFLYNEYGHDWNNILHHTTIHIHFLHHSHLLYSKRGKYKMRQFHQPFINSLIFITLCTIVSMLSVPYFVQKLYSTPYKNQAFTTFPSDISTKSERWLSFSINFRLYFRRFNLSLLPVVKKLIKDHCGKWPIIPIDNLLPIGYTATSSNMVKLIILGEKCINLFFWPIVKWNFYNKF